MSNGERAWWRRMVSGKGAPLLAVALAVLPKCPMCLLGYLSAVGLTGIAAAPLLDAYAWASPVLVGLLALQLAFLWQRTRGARRALVGCAALGAVLLVTALRNGSLTLQLLGVALVMLGTLLSGLQHSLRGELGAQA